MGLEPTLGTRGPERFMITIPANSVSTSTILSLLRLAGYAGPPACGVKILGYLPGVSIAQRPGFVAASPRPGVAIAAADFTSFGQPVDAGQEYIEPSAGDAALTCVRSMNATPINALALVVF